MKFFFQKYKFLIIPAALAIVLFGALFIFYRLSHTKKVVIQPRPEVTLTFIPGWNLRQVADYLIEKGFATSTDAVYVITGKPAHFYTSKNPAPYPHKKIPIELYRDQSYEGYLAPETFRVYRDATVQDIIDKLVAHRDTELTTSTYDRIYQLDFLDNNRLVAVNQFLTLASIVEKETKHEADRPIVADILARRIQRGWALQVDSSVHYAVDRSGDVFTTAKERQVDSFWNTYKYPGLPPGPICNPSLESINAVLYPQKNDYWYFLSDSEGNMHYASTLEEHNLNKYKYLR